MDSLFSKVGQVLGKVKSAVQNMNVKDTLNKIGRGISSTGHWLAENKGSIGTIASTLGGLSQLIPEGKVGDKIRKFGSTIGNIGSILQGKPLNSSSSGGTSKGGGSSLSTKHNILGGIINTPRQPTQQSQQWGTTQTAAPVSEPKPQPVAAPSRGGSVMFGGRVGPQVFRNRG